MVQIFRVASSLVVAMLLTGTAIRSYETGSAQTKPQMYSSHVYAWLPDGRIRRLSPGPASSPTAAMPAGPFAQANIRPDGHSVVFWGGVEGKPQVWLYDFQTASSRPATAPIRGALEPSFDWQGQRVVFAADAAESERNELLPRAPWRRSNENLFIMDADGSNVRQITDGAFQDSRPAFSPDGKHVIFLSNRGGSNRQLYIVSTDRSERPRRLIEESVVIRPWFSHDGKFIYFTYGNVEKEEQVRIWRIPAGGGAKEPITPEGLPNSQGLFVDPDGVNLWFHSTHVAGDNKTIPYRFNLQTAELMRMMPPGFTSVGHISRSMDGVITFDSVEIDPTARR